MLRGLWLFKMGGGGGENWAIQEKNFGKNLGTNQNSTNKNSAKLCYIPWKFHSDKPRPLEIPHDFFLVTPGNSTSFLINL